MLSDAIQEENDAIVSWAAQGRAFRVHQPDKFAETILPRYFNQTKFKSFQRQLHIYGFKRIRHGVNKGAYYHALFVRDQKLLCLRMTRQKIKGQGRASPSAVCLDETWTYAYGSCQSEVHTEPSKTHATQYMEQSTLASTISRSQMDPGFSLLHRPENVEPDLQPLFDNSELLDQVAAKCFAPEGKSRKSTDTRKFDFCNPCLKSSPSSRMRQTRVTAATALFQRLQGRNTFQGGREGFFAGRRFFFVETTEDPKDSYHSWQKGKKGDSSAQHG